MGRLIRMRVLDSARVQGRLVMAMDGSGYLVFRWQHCAHCLTQKAGEQTLYCHKVLEAKILGPAETVLSLGTEFIDNRTAGDEPAKTSEQKRKQDCELKAAGRLLPAVRTDFPQLRLCLSLDALYACGAGFQLAKDYHASFVIVFKEGSIPTLWQEFQTGGYRRIGHRQAATRPAFEACLGRLAAGRGSSGIRCKSQSKASRCFCPKNRSAAVVPSGRLTT